MKAFLMFLKKNPKKELLKGEYAIFIPEGSIGRPFDEVYELRETIIDEQYEIIFIGGIRFLFDTQNQFHFYKNSLFVVVQEPSILILGIETVLNRNIEVKKLEQGIVSFINICDSRFINELFEFKKTLER